VPKINTICFNCFKEASFLDIFPVYYEGPYDGYDHGTHVAGTIGGEIVGVAKDVRLLNVKVFNSRGRTTTSAIIRGILHVAHDCGGANCIANMSFEGGASWLLDFLVRTVIRTGVTVVVAAGNWGTNACNRSPARVAEAITVGATNKYDYRCYNYGTCVDIFAPGVNIFSAHNPSRVSYRLMSGTSMATPHVAGAAARMIESLGGKPSPAEVKAALLADATVGVVINRGPGSPNRLLYADCY